jgi:hypothetical protein
MDIDDVYKEIGEFGAYQKKIFWSLALMQLYLTFHNIHNVYMGAQRSLKCIHGDEVIDGCPQDNSACERYAFVGSEFTSIVTEVSLFFIDAKY